MHERGNKDRRTQEYYEYGTPCHRSTNPKGKALTGAIAIGTGVTVKRVKDTQCAGFISLICSQGREIWQRTLLVNSKFAIKTWLWPKRRHTPLRKSCMPSSIVSLNETKSRHGNNRWSVTTIVITCYKMKDPHLPNYQSYGYTSQVRLVSACFTGCRTQTGLVKFFFFLHVSLSGHVRS